MSEIIEISQPAPSSCQERIMNGPIGAVHRDKEYFISGFYCITKFVGEEKVLAVGDMSAIMLDKRFLDLANSLALSACVCGYVILARPLAAKEKCEATKANGM